MKYLIFLLLASNSLAGDLIWSKPYPATSSPADGVVRAFTPWVNPTGQPIYIKRVQVSLGGGDGLMSVGAISRLPAGTVKNPQIPDTPDQRMDTKLMYWLCAGEGTMLQNFSPDYFLLNPGEELQFSASFTGIPSAVFVVYVWYTIGAP